MLQPKKFSRVKEDFICGHCNNEVQGNGYTNHCPNCLYSKHVDYLYPGDRSSQCREMMKPLFWNEGKKGRYIIHCCQACQVIKKNKVSKFDNPDLIDMIPFGSV